MYGLSFSDGAGRVEGLDRGVAGEVPGRAGVAGGAEHVDGAGLVGVVRRRRPAHEHLARVVGVAPAVPGHRRVAAGLPVLPGHVAERGAAGEPVGHGAVGPAGPAVAAERGAAGAITAPVVVEPGHQLARVERVLRDGGLVLRLAAALQVGVGDVQAVLVDQDVGPEVARAQVHPGAARPGAGPGRGCLGRHADAGLERGEPGQVRPLDAVQPVQRDAVHGCPRARCP